MNLNLKAVYYCATAGQRWGKGYSHTEAKKNAGITTKGQEKSTKFFVMAAIFDNPTEAELKNLFACITADQINGGPIYYRDERAEADTEMINAKHVGWLTIESNR